MARELWAPDYPFGFPLAGSDAELEEIERGWGTDKLAREWLAENYPTGSHDPRESRTVVELRCSRSAARRRVRSSLVDRDIDLRDPALDPSPDPRASSRRRPPVPVEHGRYLAEHIPGAELLVMPGDNHMWDSSEDLPAEVERFLTTIRAEQVEFDRYLATVLFTDIVGSTAIASAGGDAAWRALVEDHHRIVRGALARYRGTEMDTAGDGFFATFDGPARAVRCALAIAEAVRELSIDIRAGVHIGEMQTIDGKAGGIAVTIGSRIMAKAGASEVLVSQTVKDLVAGSGLAFEDAGEHELKGVPDRWRLYRVVG